jgi:hypothetical protein
MKENQKKYNAIDLARYHTGNMPADEMHALEKAALEDPFLADALDGYAFARNPEKELGEIKMVLDEKRKPKAAFPLFSSYNTWWKIAAMVIVMAGTGYFFFLMNSKKDRSLATKEDVAKIENPAVISPSKSDTTRPEGNVAFEKTPKEKDHNNPLRPHVPSVRSLVPAAEEEDHKEKRMQEENNVADEKAKAMAIRADKMKSRDIALNDSGEKSFFHSADTSAADVFSPNLYSTDSGNMTALNKKNAALNEVVVTGYGTKRKKSITQTTGELQGKLSGVEINGSSAYPKDGKEKFEQYISDNAVPPLDTNGNRMEADILLSFTLNKKGKPTHIKVIGSSCKPCENEAIRLLKNGPRWVGKRGTPGSVRIKF